MCRLFSFEEVLSLQSQWYYTSSFAFVVFSDPCITLYTRVPLTVSPSVSHEINVSLHTNMYSRTYGHTYHMSHNLSLHCAYKASFLPVSYCTIYGVQCQVYWTPSGDRLSLENFLNGIRERCIPHTVLWALFKTRYPRYWDAAFYMIIV